MNILNIKKKIKNMLKTNLFYTKCFGSGILGGFIYKSTFSSNNIFKRNV